MKITDAKLLHELYDLEADWKLLIGHRFKGCLPAVIQGNGRLAPASGDSGKTGKGKKRHKSKR